MKNQKGFTLIELVVVMVILGVLAATALPKFMSVGTKAHEAAVAATGGSFGTAVSMVKAQYIMNSSTGAVDVTGFGDGTIRANTSGWPEAVGSTIDRTSDCSALWNSLMQNPPKVDTSATTGTKYVAAFSGRAGSTATCTYAYQEVANMSIVYTPNDGKVTVDSTP